MALAWKASWVKALRGSNPLSSAQRETPACRGFFLCAMKLGFEAEGCHRKEHPFGCSFLMSEVSGFGSGLRDRSRSLAIGVAICRMPYWREQATVPLSSLARNFPILFSLQSPLSLLSQSPLSSASRNFPFRFTKLPMHVNIAQTG